MIDEKELIKRFTKLNEGWRKVGVERRFIVKQIIEILDKFPKADKWIPCAERLPDSDGDYLVSFENSEEVGISKYKLDKEGGAFYDRESKKQCASYGLFVNAWQTCPKRYKASADEI